MPPGASSPCGGDRSSVNRAQRCVASKCPGGAPAGKPLSRSTGASRSSSCAGTPGRGLSRRGWQGWDNLSLGREPRGVREAAGAKVREGQPPDPGVAGNPARLCRIGPRRFAPCATMRSWSIATTSNGPHKANHGWKPLAGSPKKRGRDFAKIPRGKPSPASLSSSACNRLKKPTIRSRIGTC